jgi:tRNA/tmRNA/rRNA uracil-C5-methylase (TrmA/RlmC/RlmD family)
VPGPGDLVELLIDKPAAGGRMLARLNGQVILVAGVIPGERVCARLDSKRGGVLFATAVDIIDPSSDREPPGDDPACGGRHFAHIAAARQLALKEEILRDAFRRIAHLDLSAQLPVHASPAEGYRMRARLHVKGTDLGFYREGTHELCDPRCSRQLLPETLDVLAAVSAALKGAGITDGRALELSENRAATERALYLEMAGSVRGQVGFEALLDLPGATGVGIARAGVPIAAAGSPIVADELVLSSATGQAEPVRLQRHVTGFFQGNRFLLQTLVDRVLAQVPEGPMADLYAGAGLFGVAHAASGRGEVIAVEGDPASIEDLQANAAPYGRVHVEARSVEEALRDRRTVDGRTAVVDPPRTGLSREALASLAAARPPRIVYVSCDVATLARDAAALAAAGYDLVSAEIFDLFPGTAHIETMVSMTRLRLTDQDDDF